jgi:pyruvate dehydrogenase E1 component alpha subunit
VGAGGPAAAGFALAAQALRPGTISVAFFGEGAVNQGMMMESMHLASLWKLPVLFVCKDDGWQITTQSGGLSGSDLLARAEALGVPGMDVDGLDVLAVWEAAGEAIQQVRAGGGPRFLHAGCVHLEGHFLGFQLLKIQRDPLREMLKMSGPLVRSMLQPAGAGLQERLAGLRTITGAMTSTSRDPREEAARDPLTRARAALVSEPERLKQLEGRVDTELQRTLTVALTEVQS